MLLTVLLMLLRLFSLVARGHVSSPCPDNGDPSAKELVMVMYMSGKLPPDLTAIMDRIIPDSWEEDSD